MMKKDILPNIAFLIPAKGADGLGKCVKAFSLLLNTQYLGDNARCPYGNKSQETITHDML